MKAKAFLLSVAVFLSACPALARNSMVESHDWSSSRSGLLTTEIEIECSRPIDADAVSLCGSPLVVQSTWSALSASAQVRLANGQVRALPVDHAKVERFAEATERVTRFSLTGLDPSQVRSLRLKKTDRIGSKTVPIAASLAYSLPCSSPVEARVRISSPAAIPIVFRRSGFKPMSTLTSGGRTRHEYVRSCADDRSDNAELAYSEVVDKGAWSSVLKAGATYPVGAVLEAIGAARIQLPIRTGSQASDVEAIRKWIGENFAYDGRSAWVNSEDGVKARDVKSLIETKKGDCKALTALAGAILAHFEVPFDLVEVADSDVTASPFIPSDFVHVLLFLPSLNLYLDPSIGNDGVLGSTLFDGRTATFWNLSSRRLALRP